MELLMKEYEPKYFISMEQWPDPMNRGLFIHANVDINLPLMGTNQFRIGEELEKWDRIIDLARIRIPTLFIDLN